MTFEDAKQKALAAFMRYIDPTVVPERGKKVDMLLAEWPVEYSDSFHDLVNDLIENVNQIVAVAGEDSVEKDSYILLDRYLLESDLKERDFLSIRNRLAQSVKDNTFPAKFASYSDFVAAIEPLRANL